MYEANDTTCSSIMSCKICVLCDLPHTSINSVHAPKQINATQGQQWATWSAIQWGIPFSCVSPCVAFWRVGTNSYVISEDSTNTQFKWFIRIEVKSGHFVSCDKQGDTDRIPSPKIGIIELSSNSPCWNCLLALLRFCKAICLKYLSSIASVHLGQLFFLNFFVFLFCSSSLNWCPVSLKLLELFQFVWSTARLLLNSHWLYRTSVNPCTVKFTKMTYCGYWKKNKCKIKQASSKFMIGR